MVSARPEGAGATGRGVITGVWVCAAITMAASAFNGALGMSYRPATTRPVDCSSAIPR